MNNNSLTNCILHFGLLLCVAICGCKPKAIDSPIRPAKGIVNFAGETEGFDEPAVAGAELIIFWDEIEHVEGVYDWSQIDAKIDDWSKAGKKVDVRIATVHNKLYNSPQWLYDKYNVRRIARGFWCSFENGSGEYKLPNNAILSEDESGDVSVYAKADKLAKILEFGSIAKLDANGRYSVQFDYKTYADGDYYVEAVNEAGIVERVKFADKVEDAKSFSHTFEFDASADLKIQWQAEGEISIDNVNIVKVVDKTVWKNCNFEKDTGDWKLIDSAVVSDDFVINGSQSVYAENLTNGYKSILVNDTEKFVLQKGRGYAVRADCKALEDSIVELKVYLPGFAKNDKWDGVFTKKVLELKAGQQGMMRLHCPTLLNHKGFIVEIGLAGKGKVVIDDVRSCVWSDRVPGFPNYFDETFKSKWEALVTAFADRYNDNPNIGCISVGGFGRWEEVMLDEDTKGILDEQWLTFGFTQEKYLSHIEWCMDFYKRVLDKKPLRICLAYGLEKVNDVDWIYRRTAQAAVRRGIGLKQNGLSQKYASWHDDTNNSYLFNYYRDDSRTHLAYEPGGQVYRGAAAVMGHPVSFLNRGLIDGMDNLFLYGGDIYCKNVKKYFDHISDKFGDNNFTSFYCDLGDFAMVNEHSPSPQKYKNIWFGLRQINDQETEFTVVDSNKCAIIKNGQKLIFDLDDRQQYNGLYSCVLTIDYFDKGTGPFKVKCYDQQKGSVITAGVVTKTDSGKWRRVCFDNVPIGHSQRNYLKDIQNDIIIEAGGGTSWISDVELNFVPARQYKRQLLISNEPGEDFAELESKLSCDVNMDQPAAFISIPIWSGSLESSYLVAKVFDLSNNKLITKKEFYIPADKDWLDLPVADKPIAGSYRVEMSGPKGSAGWYKGKDGSLAYRCYGYQTIAGKAVDGMEFSAAKAFCGVNIELGVSDLKKIPLSIRRVRQGGKKAEPFYAEDVEFNNGKAAIYFEPKPSGEYAIEIGDMNTNVVITPINMVRSSSTDITWELN